MLMCIATSIVSEIAFCISFTIKQRRLHRLATAFDLSIIIFWPQRLTKSQKNCGKYFLAAASVTQLCLMIFQVGHTASAPAARPLIGLEKYRVFHIHLRHARGNGAIHSAAIHIEHGRHHGTHHRISVHHKRNHSLRNRRGCLLLITLI